jgi:protein-L-isoaspartate(D-aspartate) O-methyltransferase
VKFSHEEIRMQATTVRRLLQLVLVTVIANGAAAPMLAQTRQALDDARRRMVDEEIEAAGVKNPRVLDAMRKTPRHEFVAVAERKLAYFDMAMPIGSGQTISPPFIVAYMTEQLDPQSTDKVLEIGTGSGYQAAVLSPIVAEVYSIEIVESLGQKAARTLRRLKYENVHTKIGDGYQGWAEHAPFDKIIVTCSPEQIPEALVEQLKEGGRMVIPLGERYQQSLYLYQKKDGKMVEEALRPTLFVPMTGAAEDGRHILPDPTKPGVANGAFDEALKQKPDEPAGWHYLRQAELVDADGQGKHLRFANQVPGRGCQALQAFAVDGRKVAQLTVSLRVQGKDIAPGQDARQLPSLAITFYDERRAVVAERGLGPWRGSFSWQPESAKLQVPKQAREAIIRIGLMGAVGELGIDDVDVRATE